MSKRPIQEKKMRRLRKLVNRRALPAYIDLVEWLKLRSYAQTTGQAERMILDGRIKSESHTLGIGKEYRLDASGDVVEVPVVDRRVPAEYAANIVVLKEASHEAA